MPGMGRCVFATRAYEEGELVLAEKPLMVTARFPTDEAQAKGERCIRSFIEDLSQEDRIKVLTLFSPPECEVGFEDFVQVIVSCLLLTLFPLQNSR